MAKSLKPGGIMYINVPSISALHRHPVDNWRFLSDSSRALQKWALSNGINMDLLVSNTLPDGSYGTEPELLNADTI